jgi:hypothetical protein
MAYTINRVVNTYTTNKTLSNIDSVVLVDATSGPLTITLPASVIGKYFDIKKVDSSANAVTIATTSGVIDGDATKVLALQNASLTIIGSGTNFYIL